MTRNVDDYNKYEQVRAILQKLELQSTVDDNIIMNKVCGIVPWRTAHFCIIGLSTVVEMIRENQNMDCLLVKVGRDDNLYKLHPQCVSSTVFQVGDKESYSDQEMYKPAIQLVKEAYYPILASVALPANLVTILILSSGNCGLSKCISVYMVAMAITDLLVIIINVIVYHIFIYHFPFSFLSHTPVCRVILYLTAVSLDLSVWYVVSFTFDRFVVICCQKFQIKYCTKRTAVAVIITFLFLTLLKEIPILFQFEPNQIINKVQWGCRQRAAYFSSPAGIAFVWFYSTSVVWLPFGLIFLFNSITVRRILVANRTRSVLMCRGSENHRDSETENRRKSIILLLSISVTFILLWLTNAVSFVTTRFVSTRYYQGNQNNPDYIATETGSFLKLLSCFQNPCIYAVAQRKFRAELKSVVKSPFRYINRKR
ncbi:probable G-protein coupled receptor 139 [Rhincodon typus]|uniref:probable G-protein coupled receptor 139 n=1 Tax=Rhincodon typus TaxID=259920 RepID=UPI00202E62E9|nr:probable G-protein coupled receptor 139 [Rhincodon typus]